MASDLVARKLLVAELDEYRVKKRAKLMLAWLQGIVVAKRSLAQSKGSHKPALALDDGSSVILVVPTKLSRADFAKVQVGSYVNTTGVYRSRDPDRFRAYSLEVVDDPNAEAIWWLELTDAKLFQQQRALASSAKTEARSGDQLMET